MLPSLQKLFGGRADFSSIWETLSGMVNGGALLALPTALIALAIARRMRKMNNEEMMVFGQQ
jgi:hypothetical protein